MAKSSKPADANVLRREMILNGNIFKTILFLSLPSLLMATVQSLVPLIDGIFINNVIGGVAAGAISFCGPIINFMNAIGQGLGVAATAIIGQINGQGDFPLSKRVAMQVLAVSVILSVVMIPIIAVIAFPLSASISADIAADTRTYLISSSFILPFTFINSQFNAIKNAYGRPEMPLLISALFFPVKVGFNFLFIYVFPLRVLGAGLSSVASYGLMAVIIVFLLFRSRNPLDRLSFQGFRLERNIIKEIFRIGLPTMLQGTVLQVGFFLMNLEVARYGSIALTGLSVSGNINVFAFSIPSAVASAVTTMVSMNVGNSDPKRAKRACVDALIIGLMVSLGICLVMVPLIDPATLLFTRDQAILDIARRSLFWMTISSFGFSTCMILLSAFTGLGNTLVPFIINVLRVWAIRFLFIKLTDYFLGLDSVIIGNLVSNYIAALITVALFLRLKWVSHVKLKKL